LYAYAAIPEVVSAEGCGLLRFCGSLPMNPV
jgi:hypothetical protein